MALRAIYFMSIILGDPVSTLHNMDIYCISAGFPGPPHPEVGARRAAGLLSPLHHGYRGLLLAVYGDNRARLVTR